MEPAQEVLSVEFKVNLLAPAVGERFRRSATMIATFPNHLTG
jgi:hypothetical protein